MLAPGKLTDRVRPESHGGGVPAGRATETGSTATTVAGQHGAPQHGPRRQPRCWDGGGVTLGDVVAERAG